MSESNGNNNAKQKAANAGYKAAKAGKAVAKGAAGDYVGAAKDVAEGFGKEILIIVLVVIFLGTSLLAMFASAPGMIINGFTDTATQEIEEWQVSKACKAVQDEVLSIQDDVTKDIEKQIGYYIKDFPKKVSTFRNAGNNPPSFSDEAFFSGKEDGQNTLTSWELYIDTENVEKAINDITISYTIEESKGKMIKFSGYEADTLEIDPLYFVCAYSVWHQSNDLASDDEYTETDDLQERWSTSDTKGLKKFIKNNKSKFIKTNYSYSRDTLFLDVTRTDAEGNEYVDKLNIPCETLNINISVISNDEIDSEIFNFDEDQKKLCDAYYLLMSSLYSSASEDYEDATFTTNPAAEITNSIFKLSGSATYSKIYSAIDDLPVTKTAYRKKSVKSSKPSKFPDDLVPCKRIFSEEAVDENEVSGDTEDIKAEEGVATGILGKPTKKGTYNNNTSVFPYYNSGAYHAGYDIAVATGTKVYAADGGTVVSVKHLNYSYGNHIVIRCDTAQGSYYMYYCHLSSTSDTEVGDKIKKGQFIGKSGSTGNSTGPHLHFEIRKNDNYHAVINPYSHFGKSYVGGKIYG